MNPDEVKAVIEETFPQISVKPRRNPDGWSFFVGATRVARAVQSTPQAPTYFKLALSSLQSSEKVVIVKNAAELKALVESELSLLP